MTKKKFVWLLKIVVGIILVYAIYREVNKSDAVFKAFQEANWVNIFICVALLIPNFIIQFIKWRYILRNRFADVENKTVFQSLMFGATLGFITPGNLGELARALFFKKYDKFVITGLNVIDKIFGMIIFVTLGFVSLNIIMFNFFDWSAYVVFPIFILSLAFIILVWVITFNPQWVRSFLYGINTMLPARQKIKNLISCLDNFRAQDSRNMLGFSIVWFIIIFFQYHVVILAFINISAIDSLWAVSALLFTKVALPISFADLGIREGAAVFYFMLYDVPKAVAFNSALIIFVINFLIPALVGSYFVFKLRWDLKNSHLLNE